MPRHVVTVYPKLLVLPTRRNRGRRNSIVSRLGRVYRVTPHPNGDALEIHFPKRKSRREAKQEVVAALDEIDPQ